MTYKTFAINLAKQAGKITRANFSMGMKRKMKGDGSPVTKTDLAINALVVREVKKYFPEHAVIGEEQSHHKVNARFSWICDPVDGTIPFSHGMPTCTFLLALTDNGQPIVGVIYDAFMDRMFFAQKGQGAFLNGKKIKVSNKVRIKGAYISIGAWPHMQHPMPGIIDDLVFTQRGEYFGMGSVGYNAALVAAGELDGVILGGGGAHDIAALKIVVEEAGGKVTDVFGHEQRYDRPVKGCIASNGMLHNQLYKLVKKHLKKKA